MKILIKVTKEILKKSMFCGIDRTGENCAIANAVRDIWPKAWITRTGIFVNGYSEEMIKTDSCDILLPNSAVKFIGEFDDLACFPAGRLLLKPLSFEIDVPQSVIDKIGISEVTRILENSETLELVEV